MASETELDRLKSGVYLIKNILNNKVYVGSSAQSLGLRIRTHRNQLNRGAHYNRHLQSAWNKYGARHFRFRILERCTPKECLAKEQHWIDYYDASNRKVGYNGRPKAASNLGMNFGPHTQEHKDKISAACKGHKGVVWSDEDKRRISKQQKGRKMSKEFKAKIVIALTGRPVSEATKKKMSVSAKKRGISKETREKINSVIRSKKGRAKASTSAKKRGISPETRKKINLALKNRPPVSNATKRKLSLAAKADWARRRSNR